LRLLPPLNIERSKLEAFVQALEGIISRHEQGQAY
jgi:acetylornithine/succinyldiaminopimelate/putrescine aminotransferase